jgi:hypothetical protein
MSSVGKWDGAIAVGTLGLVVAFPTIATTIHNFLDDIIPASWNWLGSTTAPILMIALGILVGIVVDKTK